MADLPASGAKQMVLREGQLLLEKGCYRARVAAGRRDLLAARQMRSRSFRTRELDQDAFDHICQHILIERADDHRLVGCFRLLFLAPDRDLQDSYSGQFYDLKGHHFVHGAKLELGRFCMSAENRDPDVLRLAWGAVTQIVDLHDVRLLFGCSSFAGSDPQPYRDAIALLQHRYLAPQALRPGIKAPLALRFADLLSAAQPGQKPDLKRAQAQLPPLLRSYLSMGGWVGDHLVVDRDLDTCHVFTGLLVDNIPARRQSQLRSVATPLG